MGVKAKPWSKVMPIEDVRSFPNRIGSDDRPMTAGVRPAVVIVDMTKKFVDSNYPTGWSPTGFPAVEANSRLVAAARVAKLPIFFTKAFAEANYAPQPAERGGSKTSLPTIQLASDPTQGDVIVDELAPLPGEIVVPKGGKPSAFFGTPLASYLIHESVDTVIVTGMTTSGCVRATALDAYQFNFKVVIPFECSADRSQLSHKVSLFDMHMKYADVISLEETLEYIAGCNRA